MDKNFKLIGGGFAAPRQAQSEQQRVGPWALLLRPGCCAILNQRRQRQRFKFPLRPVWAETTLAAVGCIVALGATWLVNSTPGQKAWSIVMWRRKPSRSAEGLFIAHGYAVPVLIAIGIGALMTFLAPAPVSAVMSMPLAAIRKLPNWPYQHQEN